MNIMRFTRHVLEVEQATGEIEDVLSKINAFPWWGSSPPRNLGTEGAFPPLLLVLIDQDGDDGIFPLFVNPGLVVKDLLEGFAPFLVGLMFQKKNYVGPFFGIFQSHRKHQVSLFGASPGIHKDRRLGLETFPISGTARSLFCTCPCRLS